MKLLPKDYVKLNAPNSISAGPQTPYLRGPTSKGKTVGLCWTDGVQKRLEMQAYFSFNYAWRGLAYQGYRINLRVVDKKKQKQNM